MEIKVNKNNEKIIQNLKDADCSDSDIELILSLKQTGKHFELLRLLSKHRKNLLDMLHKNQKQIDCLDYLIFNIEQEIKGV